jgi:2-polyprenyl-3-methyl-5-hydroxy-6-metoxy-1,4-benzoquinol methylase
LTLSVSGTPAQQPSPLAIFAIIQSYQRTFVLKAGVELGLFTVIGEGKQTVAEIAKACGASERGVRILCDALVANSLLLKAGNSYSLSPDAALFLDRRSPAYFGNALQFLLHPSQIDSMTRLAEAVRKGGATEGNSTLSPEDPVWEEFARGMAPLMVPLAEAIANQLQPVLAGKTAPKVLDIAAGHGMFGITLARHLPAAHVYALDWANVLPAATENARRLGVAERHHLIPGDAFSVNFGTGYEAVLLTNFLHHFSPARNVVLLRKCVQAMNPGGRLVILEFVPNEDRVSPFGPAMFSATMLSTTPEGDAYTFRDLSDMCTQAGLEGPQMVSLDPMPQSLVLARKPL